MTFNYSNNAKLTSTETANATVKKILIINMPQRPSRCRVLLPARSMRGMETSVIITMIPPTETVAYVASSWSKPTLINKSVE